MGALAGISTVLSPILTGVGVPGAVTAFGTQVLDKQLARAEARRSQEQALAQLQSRQGLDEKQAQQNAVLEKQRLANEADAADLRRKQAMRRAVARQKTLFSAQGLSGGDAGSNEAVLLGLINDSEQQGQQAAALDTLRQTALDQSLEQQKQKNLLQATQLAQRQSLTRYLDGYL